MEAVVCIAKSPGNAFSTQMIANAKDDCFSRRMVRVASRLQKQKRNLISTGYLMVNGTAQEGVMLLLLPILVSDRIQTALELLQPVGNVVEI
jgi:hypothetical protein